MVEPLKIELVKRGIKQSELAEKIGVRSGLLSNKLNSRVGWKVSDIKEIMLAMELTPEEVVKFFLY